MLPRSERQHARVLASRGRDEFLKVERNRCDRELTDQLHIGWLRHTHLLKESQLLDLDLAPRLQRGHLLKSERDFRALDIELRSRSDDLPRLSENKLLLRCDNQR